jgi:hypothetical protein
MTSKERNMDNNKKILKEIHSWYIWQILLPLSYVPLLIIINFLKNNALKITFEEVFSNGDLILLSAIIIFNFSLELSRKKTDFLKKEFFQVIGIALIVLYIIIKCFYVFKWSMKYNVACFSIVCIILSIFICIIGSCNILNYETKRIFKKVVN